VPPSASAAHPALVRRVVDTLGFDPRSSYVEDWLGILGPSTTWLLRRLAAGGSFPTYTAFQPST
jgi:hypothetical protein